MQIQINDWKNCCSFCPHWPRVRECGWKTIFLIFHFFKNYFKTSQQVTSISGELMEGWNLQITCKIAKRVQTINIVIWQADILLQVNECARSVIVRFTRRQIGKHTQTARLQIHTCTLAERSSRGETMRQKHWLTAAPVTTEALLKVTDICLLVLLFFFLDAQIAQWVKTGRAPRSTEAEYVHFLFPKPFLLTGRNTFFFLGILSLLFSFFLFFPFSSKIIFPTSLCQQLPALLYSTGKTRNQRLCSSLLCLHGFDESSSLNSKAHST